MVRALGGVLLGLLVVLVVVPLGACISSITGNPNRPEVKDTGGTWTCKQIVEDCDNACTVPSCLDECTARGTPDAQAQHSAAIACGQRNFCMNEDCMRASCQAEMEACAPEAAAPADPPLAEPAPAP